MIDRKKEIIQNLIIYFLKNTRYCGTTKLVKLLFFLDSRHYAETGVSFTGLEYKAYEHGPYPEEVGIPILAKDEKFLKFLNISTMESGFTKLSPKVELEEKYFSKRLKRILEELVYVYKETKMKDMVDISHELKSPWDKTIKAKGAKAVIDYDLCLNEKSPSKDRMEEKRQNYNDMREILG